jgi:2-succinyl-5-enolpyruvyl-6-hydroxy-3-cyclohexene-1-carboxylate synthase
VARTGPLVVQVGGPGVIDPDHNVSAVSTIDELLARSWSGATGTTWAARWKHAERRADEAIAAMLAADPVLTEPAAARAVAEHLPDDAVLTVASSMPVRDLEWFGGRRARAHANRGANGIDGVLSTALGRARCGRPSVVLLGDLAFVHDANALVGLRGRGLDLRIVVVDNDGGGIFSFLPQAEVLPSERFEQLFGTPLDTDVVALAQAHGIPARTVDSAAELARCLGRRGPWMVRVPSSRAANVAVHAALHAAVAAALG